jgi:hypothetical protein
MTETAAAPDTIEGVRARFREIAPFPEAGGADLARDLSRYLAVTAVRRGAHCAELVLAGDAKGTRDLHAALAGEFAAVHLLEAMRRGDAHSPSAAAAQVLDAWQDGGGIGEWLWEHGQALGVDPDEVSKLAQAEARLEGLARPSGEAAPDGGDGS